MTFLIGVFLSSLVGCHIVLLVHDYCYDIMTRKSLNLSVDLASDPLAVYSLFMGYILIFSWLYRYVQPQVSAVLVINRVWFLHSSLELGNFFLYVTTF